MIGKIVAYKDKPDMHYVVIDYSPKTEEYDAEICILQEFLFEGDITKHMLNQFKQFGECFCYKRELSDVLTLLSNKNDMFKFTIELLHGGVYIKKI